MAELSRVTDLPARSTCVALVPVGAMPAPRADLGVNRPDPRFVTHLIAMATLSPQTRLLRRAAPETARAAYRSAADQNPLLAQAGVQTRQVA
jgi:hypothetical protein